LRRLRGSVALDSSVLIEYLMGTKTGEVLKGYLETLKPEEKVSCSLFSAYNIRSVLCALQIEGSKIR